MSFKSIVKMAFEEAVKAETYQFTKNKILPKLKEGAYHVKSKIHEKTKPSDDSSDSGDRKLPVER